MQHKNNIFYRTVWIGSFLNLFLRVRSLQNKSFHCTNESSKSSLIGKKSHRMFKSKNEWRILFGEKKGCKNKSVGANLESKLVVRYNELRKKIYIIKNLIEKHTLCWLRKFWVADRTDKGQWIRPKKYFATSFKRTQKLETVLLAKSFGRY